MGTNALWQSTDQTSAYAATGAGSRRRVREFRVSSDTFAELAVGEAVVHTTLGPPPALCHVTPLDAAARRAQRRGSATGARSALRDGACIPPRSCPAPPPDRAATPPPRDTAPTPRTAAARAAAATSADQTPARRAPAADADGRGGRADDV